MSRISDILLSSVIGSPENLLYADEIPYIINFFSLAGKETDEQVAYFPFNPDNPIYKSSGIIPKVTTISKNYGYNNYPAITVDGELLNYKNEQYLKVKIDLYIDVMEKLNIYIAVVSNKRASIENRHKNVAANFVNSMQNFLAYSDRPGKMKLFTDNEGQYYWAKWFDFDYPQDCFDSFIISYRHEISGILYGLGQGGENVYPRIKDLRYPLDFRYVNEALGVHDETIGKHCMKYAQSWQGKCGLAEMLDTHPIREKSNYVLKSRNIRFDYPADMQKVIRRKMAER